MMKAPFFVFKWGEKVKYWATLEWRFSVGVHRDSKTLAKWPEYGPYGPWEMCGAFDEAEFLGAVAKREVLSRMGREAFEARRTDGGEALGMVVRWTGRDREEVFGALLDVARELGWSIADPLFGVVLATPPEADRRAEWWLKGRRQQLTAWLFSQGGIWIVALPSGETETRYAVVNAERYGKPTPEQAAGFRSALKKGLFPDETLELHRGRVTVAGPGGAYRIQFDWEGNGKHSRFTVDFRGEGCPIVELGRSPAVMAKRTPSARSLVAVGMEHPVVAKCIPDPADRYASLHFCNRKLTKRVPREINEKLMAKAAEKNAASGKATS